MLNQVEREQLTRLAHSEDEFPAMANDLRICWTPQLGGPTFIRKAGDLEQAALMLDSLAAYDAFQLVHYIKPDYANFWALEIFEDGEWVEWSDPDSGDDFRTYWKSRSKS